MISDEVLLQYIRPSTNDDMPTLRRLEQAAVAYVQTRTGRYFGPAGARVEILHWRGWPEPLASVPVGDTLTSVESWNGTAFSAVDTGSYYYDNGFLWWNSDTVAWAPLTMPTRYRVTYNAGYTAGVTDEWNAPDEIKQAVIMLVGHWFENREAVVVGDSSSGELPLAVSALIDGHVRMAV